MIDIYNTIEIRYEEDTNEWVFTLRGREYRRPSLKEAKDKIDEPVKEKKPEFKRVQVYKRDRWGSGGFQIVSVTSIAEGRGYRGRTELWVSGPTKAKFGVKSERSKVSADYVYPVDDHNTVLVSKVEINEKEIHRLNVENEKLKEKLHPFKVDDYA